MREKRFVYIHLLIFMLLHQTIYITSQHNKLAVKGGSYTKDSFSRLFIVIEKHLKFASSFTEIYCVSDKRW